MIQYNYHCHTNMKNTFNLILIIGQIKLLEVI